MALTSLVAGTRLVSRLRHTGLRGVRWDDGWLFAGYVLFMAVGGVYAARGPELARLGQVQQQQRGPFAPVAPYPGWAAERAAVRRLVIFASPGLWLALWCVKFSLLALYRNIMLQASAYARAWWAVNIYCIVVSLSPGLCPSLSRLTAFCDLLTPSRLCQVSAGSYHTSHRNGIMLPHHQLVGTQRLSDIRKFARHASHDMGVLRR